MDLFIWLFILIVYFPFQIALNPGFGFDIASLRVFIVSLFLIWAICKIWSFKRQKKTVWSFIKNQVFDFPAAFLLLFLVLAGFSLIWAENVFWGLRKIIFFLSIFPLYFLVVNLVDSWLKIKRVVSALIFSGGLVALIGLFQFLAQFVFGLDKVYAFWTVNILPIFSGFNLGAMILAYPSWLVNLNGETIMRAFSVFSDPHIFSFYLGMILPLVIVRIRSNKPKNGAFQSFWYFVFSSLMFAGLLLSFTRGAYLAIILTFIVLAGLIWKYLTNKKTALLLFLAVLIFIVPATPFSFRFYSSFDFSEGSNLGRLEMWQEAGRLGLNHFWQGVGLGNYSLLIEPELEYRNPATAHNLYLDIFSEMGIPVLILWLGLIVFVFFQLFQRLRKEDNQKKKYLLIGLVGSLVYFSAHSFFETTIFSPVILAVLMVVLALSGLLIKDKKLDL
jgi:O-antigen ligase